jgi:acetoin utilization deacetylase AcuC-like enzyme
MDTSAMEHSFDAAVRAAGGGLSALEAIDAGEVDTAFLFSRPPGHHAESDRAMGFCLFNTAAVAAAHAIEALGMERVLLFDWDVHHGNGSMHSFYERKDVLYASVHQYPHYPGTGRSEEIGSGAGRGYTLNVPFPGGQTDDDYAAVMRELLVPIAADYDPELVIVSAGFDAHGNDPLASMNLTFDGYARMTAAVSSIVAKRPETALLFVLEGGYNLTGLEEGVRAVLEGLARGPSGDWDRGSAAPTAEKAIQAARMSLSDFFPSLLG